MIHVEPAPEPDGFEGLVRKPGKAALAKTRAKLAPAPLKSKEFPPEWRACIPHLRRAYHHTCAYLGMWIHEATGAATVDHFKPKTKYPDQAYEWTNFRLATSRVNSKKGEREDVLDPFSIEDGWFQLNIGTFKVEPAKELLTRDPSLHDSVAQTIERLDLNNETYCKAREEYHDRYHGLSNDDGQTQDALPLGWLKHESPYVAYELERQGRLRTHGGPRPAHE